MISAEKRGRPKKDVRLDKELHFVVTEKTAAIIASYAEIANTTVPAFCRELVELGLRAKYTAMRGDF